MEFPSKRALVRRPARWALLFLGALASLGGCRFFVDLDGITGGDGDSDTSPVEDSNVDAAKPPAEAADDDGSVDSGVVDAAEAGSNPLLRNCVLLLHMDEPSWTGPMSVIDSSGLGNHGTPVGSATTSPNGKFGRAAALDGSGWIDVNDSISLHPSDKLTYAAWIHLASLTNEPGVISKRKAYNDDVSFTMYVEVLDNHLWVDILNTSRSVSVASLTTNTWYHVATVYDGKADAGQRVSIYVNGVLDSTHPADSTMPVNTEHLLVGNLPNGGSTFVGLIDEVGIWTRALGKDEIKALYESPHSL